MGRRLFVSLLAILSLLGQGCSSGSRIPVVEQTRMAMGTFFTVALYGDVDTDLAERSIEAAFDTIAAIESWASASRPGSEVARLSAEAGRDTVSISAALYSVLRLAQDVAVRSDGAFDITVGPLTELWGFENEPSFPPDSSRIRALLPLVDFRSLRLRPGRAFLARSGMKIDLGAIAKGWAVDRAFEVLRERGFRDIMVDGGGDLRVCSSAVTAGKRRVWIRHPRKPGDYIGRFPLDAGAVATSGDYERYFIWNGQRLHHILDPRTGWPAKPCVSVTVVGASTVLCDAWATAIFVLGPRRGLEIAERIGDIEAMVVAESGSRLYWDATEALASQLEILDPNAKRGFPPQLAGGGIRARRAN